MTDSEAPGHFAVGARPGAPGKFRWELISATGQIMASATGFPSEDTAYRSIQWLKDNIASCPTEHVPPVTRRRFGT